MNKKMYSALLEAMPNAVYLKDKDGKYILINKNGAKIAGKSVDDFIGKTDYEIYNQEMATRMTRVDHAVLNSAHHCGEEWTINDNSFFSYKFAIDDKKSGEKILAGISTDITELKNTEKELKEARRKAEEANQYKSIFLQNMSHELRTPLNAIIGFSSMLKNDCLTDDLICHEKVAEYSNLINSSGTHLLSIINDLLDLSKIEAGEQDFNEAEIDLVYEIDACSNILKSMSEENNILVRSNLTGINYALKGDEKIFRQIMFNLLSNAIKYSLTDNEVFINTHLREDGGISIQITDNGIGMSDDDLAVAMIPFRRAERVKNTDISGSGLGLPLVDAFMKLFGGKFELKTKEGIGTTAIIEFPPERTIKD